MADLKKRVLSFVSGKKIKLFGICIGISPSLEIGECYVPNVFSLENWPGKEKPSAVNNPNNLTADELMELADYNIRLWVELKENIRKHGIENNKIFNCNHS
ncbi:hypothetical protein HF324_27780 [Chitinophaga oryzae]|uniref:Uncharacterized protein n=1 Tax=Chitinophaga oryzae TaxID=2725414 RepID=A0AAE6ZKI5_9BACT|nr:hypothetical protein [Chitinophaga oryzae]QJB34926.1 hypothetical protein HF329_27920 [Chitinophaga oryzae]QJB41437.1 hypothetical protein HF324_27780 [Chitinophaga oryzae]